MIGQEKLKAQLNNCNLDNFPNSLILLGEKGCGKHLFVDEISKHFGLPVIYLSGKLTQEMIDDIYSKIEPFIYVIENDNLNIKNQNSILKFLEEPLKNSFIILLVENENSLLPTILNRCQVWQFEQYTLQQLQTFDYSDSRILDIATTPYDIQMFELPCNNLDTILSLCDNIIDKIPVASFSNILFIINKIKFTDTDNDKIDLNVFMKVLNHVAVQKVIANENKYYQMVYKLIDELNNNLQIFNINKKTAVENYLVKMKEIKC